MYVPLPTGDAAKAAPVAPPIWHPPLGSLTSTAVDTAAAAFYLNRKPQTLRIWAAYETGPIQPIRVHGRLAWRVTDIKRVLGMEAQQ